MGGLAEPGAIFKRGVEGRDGAGILPLFPNQPARADHSSLLLFGMLLDRKFQRLRTVAVGPLLRESNPAASQQTPTGDERSTFHERAFSSKVKRRRRAAPSDSRTRVSVAQW